MKTRDIPSRSGRYIVFALFTLTLSFTTITRLQAQQRDAEPGIIRVKVTEQLATQLETASITRSSGKVVETGVFSVDVFNRQYNVTSMKRVFRSAGKFENRHRKHDLHLWYELTINKDVSVYQAISSYASLINIQKAEPVYKKAIVGSSKSNFGPKTKSANPVLLNGANDPMLPDQWHYNNTGQTGGTLRADIRLFDAWKLETGRKEIVVAITDGGIQVDHPDLAGNMWRNTGEVAGNNIDDDNNGYIDDIHGYSFVTDSENIIPDDHGTHVAGTIAAVSNNGIGVAGVAGGSGSNDGVRLMSCAAFADFSSGGFPETYVYAADNGAVISQNSWGYTFPGVYEEAVLDAIDYFIDEAGKDEYGNQHGLMRGGLVIFAAGNGARNGSFYPGFYSRVLAVAAVTHKDNVAYYSNYGDWVDISAPGGETNSNEAEGVLSTLANNRYGTFMGTSMACPHVSGVAALILSKYGKPGFTREALRERLKTTSTNIDHLNPGYEGLLGSGKVNAAMALQSNDKTPANAITNLSATDADITTVTLSWTVPNDPGSFVTSYDVRYSTSPITAANFSSASVATDKAVVETAGKTQLFTLSNLSGATVYYFAVKSIDFEGNISSISNVISHKTDAPPVIVISPTSVTESLQTAQTSTRTFTISNTGAGALNFFITNASQEKDFAKASPASGTVPPGARQSITVQFDANNLVAGTYKKDLRIETNDPLKKIVIVPLTLNVTNNGYPMASIQPAAIHFKSVQIGTSKMQTLTFHNAGSHPLIIQQITSSSSNFTTPGFAGNLTVNAFQQANVIVKYSPTSTGIIKSQLTIETNDPAHPAFVVPIEGEGLNAPPFVVTPSSFAEELAKGTRITRTMTLRNNGSYEEAFQLFAGDTEVIMESPAQNLRMEKTTAQMPVDLSTRRKQTHSSLSQEKLSKYKALGSSRKSSRVSTNQSNARITQNSIDPRKYSTTFENFQVGSVNEQEEWGATQGWRIALDNPYDGDKHFRGISDGGGMETFAVSPIIVDDYDQYPRYTHSAMRINIDKISGSSWQLVPQDPWSYVVTRIRFNADRTLEAWVIDDEYEFHWRKVPVMLPSGYFDFTVECDSWGNDTTGFPSYSLFVNNKKVFAGTGLGSGIGQMAFVATFSSIGAAFDMDNFTLAATDYLPKYLSASPMTGILPANTSQQVLLEFDGDAVRYGNYKSDLTARLGDNDSTIIPTTLNVTGPAEMVVFDTWMRITTNKGERGTMYLTLMNTGGQPINYNFEVNRPELRVVPASGTIPLRTTITVAVELLGDEFPPTLFSDNILLRSDAPGYEETEIFVHAIIYETEGMFEVPSPIYMQVKAGEIATHTVQLKNTGKHTVSFTAGKPLYTDALDFHPTEGKVTTGSPIDFTITLDARFFQPGKNYGTWVNFNTNDVNNAYKRLEIYFEVLPYGGESDPIQREEWSGVAGRTVAAIPVGTTPTSISDLTRFETPIDNGNYYGARVRGYIQAPESGWYSFWIASDDNSELWLSRGKDPTNKTRIAYINGYVNPGQWTKYPSQKSELVYMYKGYKYYIEALHKEAAGRDHLAVAWETPTGLREFPISGAHLSKYDSRSETNFKPVVTITSPAHNESFGNQVDIRIAANASDKDGNVTKVEFYQGNTILAVDAVAPYVFVWSDVQEGNYQLVAKAYDNFGAYDSAVVNVIVDGEGCIATGNIRQEIWTGISGTDVSSIPVNSPPLSVSDLTIFETPANIGDNYGSRVRGYICVPTTGNYTFWIASDDRSGLWLSTDENPVNKARIAYVAGWTTPRQWEKYTTQRSAAVHLIAGHKYYVEVLHKEATGADHVAVGWQLPDGTLERPIQGRRLMPFDQNSPPVVVIANPLPDQQFDEGATVVISANVTDDGVINKVEFFNGTNKLGEDLTAPYSLNWTPVTAGDYVLTVKATDNNGAFGTASVNIKVVVPQCTATGTLLWEYWSAVAGTSVSAIPVTTPPSRTMEVTAFETPLYYDNNYGSRVRGYICVPITGMYTFWIATDDNGELWLSSDQSPERKRLIASVPGYTRRYEWEKYSAQRSEPVQLVSGRTYYIEALHKEGPGADHLAVAWQLPDGTYERPISGIRLSPFETGFSSARVSTHTNEGILIESDGDLTVYPNPTKHGLVTLTVSNYNDESLGNAEVKIISSSGVVVYSKRVSCKGYCSSFAFDVGSQLTTGIYLVRTVINRKQYVKRLVVY